MQVVVAVIEEKILSLFEVFVDRFWESNKVSNHRQTSESVTVISKSVFVYVAAKRHRKILKYVSLSLAHFNAVM